MTPGVLRQTWPDGRTLEATRDPDGWHSEDAEFDRYMDTLYPGKRTTVGVPWVRSFWDAVEALGAEVVTEPVPDDPEPGVIY